MPNSSKDWMISLAHAKFIKFPAEEKRQLERNKVLKENKDGDKSMKYQSTKGFFFLETEVIDA